MDERETNESTWAQVKNEGEMDEAAQVIARSFDHGQNTNRKIFPYGISVCRKEWRVSRVQGRERSGKRAKLARSSSLRLTEQGEHHKGAKKRHHKPTVWAH